MESEPTNARVLTHSQVEGCSCVVCGRNDRDMIPLEIETSVSVDVCRCSDVECDVSPEVMILWIENSGYGAMKKPAREA